MCIRDSYYVKYCQVSVGPSGHKPETLSAEIKAFGQILHICQPVWMHSYIYNVKTLIKQELFQGVNYYGLISKGQKLLGHIRNIHSGAHSARNDNSENHYVLSLIHI